MDIIYISILFIFFSSCQTYKLTNKIFNKIINICNKKGCPNIYGLIIHSILFFILVYFFINLKEGISDSSILTSSEESINSYDRNNKSKSHTHDISFSDTNEYTEIYDKYINQYLIDTEDFKYIINHDNFKYLISDYENLEALSSLLNTSYNDIDGGTGVTKKKYNKLYGMLSSNKFNQRLNTLNKNKEIKNFLKNNF